MIIQDRDGSIVHEPEQHHLARRQEPHIAIWQWIESFVRKSQDDDACAENDIVCGQGCSCATCAQV